MNERIKFQRFFSSLYVTCFVLQRLRLHVLCYCRLKTTDSANDSKRDGHAQKKKTNFVHTGCLKIRCDAESLPGKLFISHNVSWNNILLRVLCTIYIKWIHNAEVVSTHPHVSSPKLHMEFQWYSVLRGLD